MSQTARATLILVAANMAVYLVIFAGWLTRGFFPELPGSLTSTLAFPSSPESYFSAPWTVFTYMFTHLSFIHLGINMLWLVGFGPMVRGGWKRTVAAYIAGGICGGGAFMAAALCEDIQDANLAGASASVLAVVVATGIISPNRKLDLFLIGDAKLKWVAAVAVITILAGSFNFSPATAAHLGGMIAGIAIGVAVRYREKLISLRAMEQARQRTRRLGLIHKATMSGFASLSEPERLELFDLRNIKVNQN